jgi:hypothetical protein
MGPLDVFWHVTGFFAVPLLLALLASASMKLLWRRELAGLGFRPLLAYASAGTVIPALVGFFVFGRDGKMLTYLGMVLLCALMLWWRGFGPGRAGAGR